VPKVLHLSRRPAGAITRPSAWRPSATTSVQGRPAEPGAHLGPPTVGSRASKRPAPGHRTRRETASSGIGSGSWNRSSATACY